MIPNFFTLNIAAQNIILENPPHIPQTGDPVNFKISDFFPDKKVIAAFEEMEEGSLLYAERLQAKYSSEAIEVIVIVYEEAIFKTLFPHFFEGSTV